MLRKESTLGNRVLDLGPLIREWLLVCEHVQFLPHLRCSYHVIYEGIRTLGSGADKLLGS